MKTFLLLVSLCGTIFGCRKQMTNDAIIKETKKCEDAGMAAEFGRNLEGEIIDVQCGPKVKP